MDRLYAPWRSGYVGSADDKGGSDTCVFCAMFAQSKDEEHFILRRFEHCVVMLNKFPYNSGHLMILPLMHVADLEQLPQNVRHEIVDLTATANTIVKKVTNCQALNVGLNLGKAAGGSQASHLHVHVLPRWSGDTNFLATLANTKTISVNLEEMYLKLKPEFEMLGNQHIGTSFDDYLRTEGVYKETKKAAQKKIRIYEEQNNKKKTSAIRGWKSLVNNSPLKWEAL